MVNKYYKNPKFIQRNKSIDYIPFIFFILTEFAFLACDESCSLGTYLHDSSCFNGIIKIDHLNYRSGHFASKKNGDLVIEYSGNGPNNKRLFYGLKVNGRGYFNDGYIREKDLPADYGRYEARNLFVSPKNDINKETEYLFSTSSYESWTELHDLESNTYVTKNSDSFNNDKRLFAYVFSLFGKTIDNKNYYFLLFTSDTNIGDERGELYILRKYAFSGFNLDVIDKKQIEIAKFSDRVISGFIMDEENVIVIYFLNKFTESGRTKAQYTIRFYDYELNKVGDDLVNYNDKMTEGENDDLKEKNGIYSNSIYLKDKYGLFIYFFHYKSINQMKFIFHCFKFKKEGSSYINELDYYDDFINRFDPEITLSDVHKINENKVAVVTTSDSGTKLYIILLDIYGTYDKRKFRNYNYNLFSNYKLKKELAVYSYNGEFLAFTSTIVPTDNGDFYTSFLLFFSYPNGTDFTIDIGPYLKDSKYYNPSKNLFSDLMNTMKIENNIFRYKKIQKIKLVSIPNEIIFYNLNDNSQIQNGDYLYTNYEVKQNTESKKTYEYYHLFYQFIAKEPSYDELYYDGLEIKGDSNNFIIFFVLFSSIIYESICFFNIKFFFFI